MIASNSYSTGFFSNKKWQKSFMSSTRNYNKRPKEFLVGFFKGVLWSTGHTKYIRAPVTSPMPPTHRKTIL